MLVPTMSTKLATSRALKTVAEMFWLYSLNYVCSKTDGELASSKMNKLAMTKQTLVSYSRSCRSICKQDQLLDLQYMVQKNKQYPN